MLFVVYAILVAFGTKVAVKDVPEMLSRQIGKTNEALNALQAIPEKDRDGVLIPGRPLYMTPHHAEQLDKCTNDCMGIIEEMAQIATLLPSSMNQWKKAA